jgi:hypothetical protein
MIIHFQRSPDFDQFIQPRIATKPGRNIKRRMLLCELTAAPSILVNVAFLFEWCSHSHKRRDEMLQPFGCDNIWFRNSGVKPDTANSPLSIGFALKTRPRVRVVRQCHSRSRRSMFPVAIAPISITTGHHDSEENIAEIDQGAEREINPTRTIRKGNDVTKTNNPAMNQAGRRRFDK